MNAYELIKYYEGSIPHIYVDTQNVPTCGVGHALHLGSKVPPEAVEAFYRQDLEDAIRLYESLDLELDHSRMIAVIDMCFNLGPQLRSWKFIEALRKHDFKWALWELKNSKWWSQVGRRSKDIYEIIETGEIPDRIFDGIKNQKH